MTNFRSTIAVGAAAMMLLAGCSTGNAPQGSTSSPAATLADKPSTASSTPSPTPTPTAKPAVITTAGFGDLKLGSPVPSGTKLVSWDPTACVSPDTGLTAGDALAGAWTSKYTSTYSAGAAGLVVDTKDRHKGGKITDLIVYSSKITTRSGAHVGSTVAQLKKIFPTLGKPIQGEQSDLYVIKDNIGQVIFEVFPTRLGDQFDGGEPLDTVVWILVKSKSAETFGLANSDAGSTCPG